MTPDEDYARRLTFFQGQREANARRKEEAERQLMAYPMAVRVLVWVLSKLYVAFVWLFDREIWRCRIGIVKFKWLNWRLARKITRNERLSYEMENRIRERHWTGG